MSRLVRRRSPRGLQSVVGLAAIGLTLGPSASAAAPLDTVTATGDSGLLSPRAGTRLDRCRF
jgi:hypothetical protein